MIINNETIGIIVPVYNVEKYIDKCVQSIVTQTYSDIEIVLVDDGSTDNSGKICDKYAEHDDRIKVIHKQNGGLADARNIGALACMSNHVTFIDSDDYVDSNHIESLVSLMKVHNVEISCTPLIYEYENGKKKKTIRFNEKTIKNSSQIQSLVLRAQYGIGVTVCSKLFPRELVLRHPFPVGRIHEDLAITMELYDDIGTASISDNATYHYVQRLSSITHKDIDFESLFWIIEIMERIMDSHSEDRIICTACVYRIFDLANEICRVVKVHRDYQYIRTAQKMLRKHYAVLVKDEKTSYKYKIKGFLLSNSLLSFLVLMIIKNWSNWFVRIK